ncbi:MAG TPA: Ig-like domain repeat protein [Pseudonocardiaceae bacterium]|nr:Ig-like domain repeat protein [Pseudonocardiaceae bacterium]
MRRFASQPRWIIFLILSAVMVLATTAAPVIRGQATASAAVAAPAAPVNVTVRVSGTVSGPAAGFAEIKTDAGCPRGSLISGGGINQSIGTGMSSNGNHVNGAAPSADGSGEFLGGSGVVARDVAHWLAVGGSGAVVNPSFSTTSFALCLASDLITHTQIVVTTLAGPVKALTPAVAVASCPANTVLLGGGARTTPASAGSLKPIASYPTFHNAAHGFGNKPAADRESNPDSWTAVGLNGGGASTVPNTTYAYAICGQPTSGVTVTVHSQEVSGPATSTASQTVTTSCGPSDGTLISGGAAISGGGLTTKGFTAPGSQGDHLNGSFPSNTSGAPASNGTATATSWTAYTHTGGADSPQTFSEAWALCARTNSAPVLNPAAPPGVVPGIPQVPGPTIAPGSPNSPGLPPISGSSPGSTTSSAPPPGIPSEMATLTIIEIPMPLNLGGIAIPIAQVTPTDAAGTVQCQDGTTNLGGPVPVDTGTAIGPIYVLHTGSHSLTATFTPTNPANVQPLTSNTVTFTF